MSENNKLPTPLPPGIMIALTKEELELISNALLGVQITGNAQSVALFLQRVNSVVAKIKPFLEEKKDEQVQNPTEQP